MRQLIADLTTSSLGRKYIMALTGLGGLGFLVMHLGGNLLVFAGPERFNAYAHHLHSFVLLPVLEYALFAMFMVHIFFGAWITVENWRARPVRYAVKKTAGASNVASSTMIYTGLAIFAFLIVHMWTVNYGVPESMPAYERVTRALTSPFDAVCYILGILAVGIHLFHGAASTFESLGLNHPKYERPILVVGQACAAVLAVGFVSIPFFVMVFLSGGPVR